MYLYPARAPSFTSKSNGSGSILAGASIISYSESKRDYKRNLGGKSK